MNGHTTVDRSRGEVDWLYCELQKPDLQWYFETAATPPGNREQVFGAVGGATKHVRMALRLQNERGKIVWWWPRLPLLAAKP